MYAKGLTTRQISEQIEDIYGFKISECMVSDITNKLLPEIEEWQKRPLVSIYPIVSIDKDKKIFVADLKTIYHVPSEEARYEQMKELTKKWQEHYATAMMSWSMNWDVMSLIFKFPADIRKVIYTTNAIESLNSTYSRLNSQRCVFPSHTALLNALCLDAFEAKWTLSKRNCGKGYGDFSIL